MELNIRSALLEDAKELNKIKTMDQVFQTTCNDLGESLQQTRNWLNGLRDSDYLFVAEVGYEEEKEVVGYVMLEINPNPRFWHTANLRIAVSKDYQKKGIGSSLLKFILNYADNWLCLVRVELTVMERQTATVELYQKFGFVKEGLKRKGVTYDGQYVDVLYMGRLNE